MAVFTRSKQVFASCLLSTLAMGSSAAVQTTQDHAVFESRGTMTQVTDATALTDVYGNGITPTNGASLTDRGLTFDNASGWLLGTGAVFAPVDSVYAANPIHGLVTENADLLGFQFGYLGLPTDNVNFSITTSLGTYSLNVVPTLASSSLAFVGFQADQGEFFKSFSISSATLGTYPVISAVQLGVSAVPEAETYAMLLAGLGAIGLMSRRRKPESN